MAKPRRRVYTPSERVALVAEVDQRYRTGGRTYAAIARELGIGETTYHGWVAQGILPPPPSPTPPKAQKRPRVSTTPAQREEWVAQVKRLHAAGQTISQACRAVGIGEKTFRVWRAQGQPLPPMRPVELTAVLPSPPPEPTCLTLVSPGGYRLEGLHLEAAATLLRTLP